jgi:hypothetical protein
VQDLNLYSVKDSNRGLLYCDRVYFCDRINFGGPSHLHLQSENLVKIYIAQLYKALVHYYFRLFNDALNFTDYTASNEIGI